ncbi:MAG: hypothetical protein J5679_02780 [Alphaproteobacteria bacterium]|nr:hypothetical protein [Alphaproteobacteria bacterium]
MTDLEKDFVRTFATPSGQRVLEHLRKITIERTLGANATDAELRWGEAQRALVHKIENMSSVGDK